MPDMKAIQNTPDISFIDNKTIDDVRGEMVADYEKYMEQATGQTVSLNPVSQQRIVLNACALQIYQAMQFVDRAGKQNLLKYSYSDWLDNLALLKGIVRSGAKAATTSLRFSLGAARQSATGIPAGTRVASSGSIYFQTKHYVEIAIGTTSIDVLAICTLPGTVGNGLAIGELSTMVDPVAYVASVTNVTATEGGAEIESDEDLAERIYLAPSGYSTAGPEEGYLYHAKQYNSSIGDVVASSDQAGGRVDIVFIMANGEKPGSEMITGLQEHLRDNNIRPMTDLVNVSAPTEVTYSIDLTYYINRSDSALALSIQNAVGKAVEDFVSWQRAIGRDINPSKLMTMVMTAGAKRVQITSPVFTAVARTSVSKLSGAASVNYGGLEDD